LSPSPRKWFRQGSQISSGCLLSTATRSGDNSLREPC
jgi:hypothetical protein